MGKTKHHHCHKKRKCDYKWTLCTDYIVVGLGTAGAALTRRLADAGKRVVAFEAGLNLSDDPFVLKPLTALDSKESFLNMVFNQKYANTSFVMDVPNSTTGVVFEQYSEGRMWGGSSAHNAQQAVRGDATIYDKWAEEVGDAYGTGPWSYGGLLPYFKKVETFNVLPTNPFGQSSNITIDTNERGTSGPVQFTQDYVIPTANPPFLPPQLPPLLNTFFDILGPFTGSTVSTTGAPGNFMVSGDDYNLPQNKLGAFIQQRTLTPELDPNARIRSFSSNAYLPASVVTPEGKGVNNHLTIVSGATVVKVIFRGTKAIGVLYNKNGVSYYARAKKEVILCAGAIQTPAILQRSGVGDETVLSAAGVETLVNNPNVGQNLSQHYGSYARISCPYGIPFVGLGFNSAQLFLDGTKSPNYGSGFVEGDRKLQIFMQVVALGVVNAVANQTTAPATIDSQHPYAFTNGDPFNGQSFANFVEFYCWNLLPKAKGSVLITSADPFIMPTLDYGLFSDSDELKDGNDNDLTAAAAMVDIVNSVSQTVSSLLPGSNVEMITPNPLNIVGNGANANDPENVQQNTVAKDTLKAQLINPLSIPWHPSGTCKMSTSSVNGVVDKELRVFNCQRLRVADNSVIPIIPSGNTQDIAYAIGEKAFDLLMM